MHIVPLTHQLVTIQDDFDLDKIIESGQCFRPQKLADGRYRFLSGGALLYLTPLGAGQYDAAWYGSDWECWANYFDLDRNMPYEQPFQPDAGDAEAVPIFVILSPIC